MSTATVDHTILAEDGSFTVQAQLATPGLYVYETPDTVDVGATCRWKLGHHSGHYIARFTNPAAAHAVAAALAGWIDWTGPVDGLKSSVLSRSDRMEFLRIIEDGHGHLGNCAHPERYPDWLPNGGHTGPMCAYVAGMSSRCTCA